MRAALAFLLCVACSRPTPAPSPAPSASAAVVVATASASASASASAPKHPDALPQRACEGANLDLGWALHGSSCKPPKSKDAGRNDVSSLRATLEPSVVNAADVKTTKLDVWIQNTSNAPVVLDLVRRDPVVEPLTAKGQTAGEKFAEDIGLMGVLNMATPADDAHVTIAPQGWAYVKASLVDEDPNNPGSALGGSKRDAGPHGLPPGTYRVVLSPLRALAITNALEVR